MRNEDETFSANAKLARLKERLAALRKVAVAFSGGVDSSFLLAVAADTLGETVLAVTAESPTLAGHERTDALELVKRLQVEHVVLASSEMELPAFTVNSAMRCYVCKLHRYGLLREYTNKKGFQWLLDGENADDAHDFRPGSRAARELGVLSPLADVGLTKTEIRELSHTMGLPTWNKPAYACLASRLPYGVTITGDRLDRIERAERFLMELFPSVQLRVRDFGDIAKIETEAERIPDLVKEPIRSKLTAFLTSLGFKHVTLDLEGYRTGALNEGPLTNTGEARENREERQ